MPYPIQEERLTAEAYIGFLKRTDLGSQYPKERFVQRIGTLIEKTAIGLAARNAEGDIAGVCFGITDLASDSDFRLSLFEDVILGHMKNSFILDSPLVRILRV